MRNSGERVLSTGCNAMTLVSPGGFAGIASFPRSLVSLAVWVGALALFLVVASWLLVSCPISSTVQGSLLGIDHSRKVQSTFLSNQTVNLSHLQRSPPYTPTEVAPKNEKDRSDFIPDLSSGFNEEPAKPPGESNSPLGSNQNQSALAVSDGQFGSSLVSQNDTAATEIDYPVSRGVSSDSRLIDNGGHDNYSISVNVETANETTLLFYADSSNSSKSAEPGDCDLYHGKWLYDAVGPLYTNNTCPILTQMQNCQGNGRPDKEYENWRWKPHQCDLPRFDAKKFLKLMRGKTLAFVGDSVARNQMESLMCILWQVETPKNRGNRRMQRWFFKSNSVSIVRIWSSWLVHKFSDPFQFAPAGIDKLRLDLPDNGFFDFLPRFDVLVLSSGHWFAKQSVYILNEEIVGGQLWSTSGSQKKIDNVEAFGISVERALSAIATHPNYTGLTIVRSFSPDHYEGGTWNTGGSCTGKVKPLPENEVVVNGFTEKMHEKQVEGFERARKKLANGSKLRLMDITAAFGMRADGHPGPYRNPDPNKVTKRGPNGEPPPQDCLHWCMPGPVDTWNELLLEIIRRDFEGFSLNLQVPRV